MVAIGAVYLVLGKLYSARVSATERAALALCIFALFAIFCTGYLGYFVVDKIWSSFYYAPVAEGKNVWLGLQAGCAGLYLVGIILVTMGVRRATRTIVHCGY